MTGPALLERNPPAIQAVVVLYKVAPEASTALRGLLDALAKDEAAAAAIAVLVYDNSPQARAWQSPPRISVEYVQDPGNSGLLGAYRHALARARENAAPWLLLLDDDTQVTAEFVRQQLQMAEELAATPDIGAVVPRLRKPRVARSPHGPVGWRQSPLPVDRAGPAPVATTAFNSGAMLRRAAVEAMGGFPDGYPLDFLDHAIFARLARAGFRVWVLPVTLEHAMTWDDPAGAMGFDRFARVLEAERRFHREYGGIEGAVAFRLRCGLRAWRSRKWPDKRFAQACWRMATG